MNATNDRIKGTFNSSIGKIKKMVGHAINDKNLERAGTTQTKRGKFQKRSSLSEDNIQKEATADGRSINNAGDKEAYITD